jgi:hypothetical protein
MISATLTGDYALPDIVAAFTSSLPAYIPEPTSRGPDLLGGYGMEWRYDDRYTTLVFSADGSVNYSHNAWGHDCAGMGASDIKSLIDEIRVMIWDTVHEPKSNIGQYPGPNKTFLSIS